MRITPRNLIALLLLAGLTAVLSYVLLPQTSSTGRENISTAQATKDELVALFVGEPTAKRAMYELFGLGKPLPDSLKGAVTSEFAKLKYQKGPDPMISILLKSKRLDPKSGTFSDCHACGVALSAVDYTFKDGAWKKVSESIDFTEVGSWGDADAGDVMQTPKELSKDTTAFMFDSGWSGQGYTDSYKIILAFHSSKWKSLGAITTGSDNAGDCEDKPEPKSPSFPAKPCWENTGVIEVLPSSTNSYNDILVRMKGTTADADGVVIPATDAVYTFSSSGEYLEKRTKVTKSSP